MNFARRDNDIIVSAGWLVFLKSLEAYLINSSAKYVTNN